MSDGHPEAEQTVEVRAVWRGGYGAEVRARDHLIEVDEPVADGGEDRGPMPTELLCAALASCLCLAVAHVAAKRAIELPDLRIDVRGDRDGRALRYGRLVVTARSSLPEPELSTLVRRAQRFCWVSNMFARPPTIELGCETVTSITEVP